MSDDRRLFYWSLTSALAGFLFGFDTVVISGAEQTIQHIWNLSAGVHGIAMGAALYGTVLGGLGIGVSTVAAPMYISEIAPPERRGRLAALFQFDIVLGIVIAFASNAIVARIVAGPDAWRWMLGVAAAPSLVYSLMCLGLPESPRWLRMRAEGIMTDRTATRGGFW